MEILMQKDFAVALNYTGSRFAAWFVFAAWQRQKPVAEG
jgi:hypothetical protein